MKRFPALAPVVVALAVVWSALAGRSCAQDVGPQLVRVLEVAPHEVELGDTLTITGDGFPPGRAARVTLRGALHRPGERPVRDAEIVASGTAAAPDRIELPFDETLQALLCGAGDRATHTTFEGDVEVAFASAMAGASPIAGILQHVVIDVRPSVSASNREREADGERVLAWIGARAAPRATGLVIDSVAPGSRAEEAGLAPGAILASFDGVRVASAGDVVPPPGELEAKIIVRNAGGGGESAHVLAVSGFRRAPPADLVEAALIVLAALAVVCLFGAPIGPSAATKIQRLASRLRERLGGGARANATARPLRACAAMARDALPEWGTVTLVDATVCAMLGAMPFGQYVVAARLDVGLLFLGAATALAAAALVANGSAWRGVVAAGHVAWQHVPAAVAVASVIVTTGSLRMQEIERCQGGFPWEWLAFRSPAALVALALLLACSLIDPEARDRHGILALVDDEGTRAPAARARWIAAACRGHRIVVAGLASALFLGGWLLPGLSPAEQDARPILEVAGGAWFLSKTCAVFVAMEWSRRVIGPPGALARTRATAIWLAPLAIVTFAVTAAWAWWSPARTSQLLVSGSMVGAVALAVVALGHRFRHGLTSAQGDGHLNPFL